MPSNPKFAYLKTVLILFFYSVSSCAAVVQAQIPTITNAAFYFNGKITGSVLESNSDSPHDKRRVYLLKITGSGLEKWRVKPTDYMRGEPVIVQHLDTILKVEIRFAARTAGKTISTILLENGTKPPKIITLDRTIKVKTELF